MIPNRQFVDETLPPRVGCLNHNTQYGFDIGDWVANVGWAVEPQPMVRGTVNTRYRIVSITWTSRCWHICQGP